MPGIPRMPSAVDGDAGPGGTWRRPFTGKAAYSCQPAWAITRSPGANPSARDSMTSPTVPPTMTAPISTGGE